MNKILKDKIACILGLTLVLAVSACSFNERKDAGKTHDKYTCPMHPGIIREEPGSCPVCGMDLVKVHVADTSAAGTRHLAHKAADSLGILLKRPDQYVMSSIKTIKPQQGADAEDLVFSGVATYDTKKLRTVAARVAGRIEKLYIKYNYQRVEKGQKLMDIYSPDLLAAQRELLFLRNSDDQELLMRAKQKLLLLGATEQQISGILRTGLAKERFAVFNPYSGYVIQASAAAKATPPASDATSAASSGEAMSGMSGAPPTASTVSFSTTSSQPFTLVEGQYLNQGQSLFQIVDDSSLWAEFYVRPELVQNLRKGEKLSVYGQGQETLKAGTRIDVILPYYKDRTQFTLVRASLPNEGKKWKAGQLLSVKVKGSLQEGHWLPRMALLNVGTRYVVFVKRKGAFVPQAVQVLGRSNDLFNVGNGIPEDAEVAENAWFLVDSESFIRVQDEYK